MNVLILAAGYATRLYPLTLNQPKPLLEVGGKPMMEHVLDHLLEVPDLGTIYIVTNNKFATHFTDWAAAYNAKNKPLDFKIINDGSTSDDDKLGAIGDLHLVLTKENVQDDLLVVAGDNLFDSSLAPFVDYAKKVKTPVLAVYDVGSLEVIKKYSCITLDENDVITFFEEKSKEPHSTLAGIALYYFPADSIPKIHQYIAEGNNPDQPGRLIQWLYTHTTVHSWRVPGLWFDIGSKDTLEEANQIFSAKK